MFKWYNIQKLMYIHFVPLKTYNAPRCFWRGAYFLEEIMTRREERELAFTLIFEKIFNEDLTVSEIVDIAIDAELLESDNLFAISLAQMTDEHTEEFDSIIAENAVGWRLERLPKVSVAILRLALCEMFYVESIPVKVSANEAVELAKKFGTKDDAAFINGLLGKVIKEKDLK